jgi:hypothetical protein
VTFTATVSVTAPGAGTPTGTVTFMDGAATLGTGTVSGGVATFTTATLSVGHHNVTAVYGGDASFNGSSSTPVDQEVQKAETTTALTSSVNPSAVGQSVTFTATVTVAAPGAGTPTGTVSFKEGATTLGTGTVNGAGVATFTTAALAAGSHYITATFSGDGSFNGSTSNVLQQDVRYTFAGFFAPVDNLPIVNNAKAAQAIPVKWRLSDFAGAGVSDPGNFLGLTSYVVGCGDWTGLVTDAVPEVAAGSSGLQYLGDGNWQFNWKTPKEYANQCRVARVALKDGTFKEFNVKFKP